MRCDYEYESGKSLKSFWESVLETDTHVISFRIELSEGKTEIFRSF